MGVDEGKRPINRPVAIVDYLSGAEQYRYRFCIDRRKGHLSFVHQGKSDILSSVVVLS